MRRAALVLAGCALLHALLTVFITAAIMGAGHGHPKVEPTPSAECHETNDRCGGCHWRQ